MATGIVNAGGSFGQFTLVPIAQGLIGWVGWMAALWWLAMLMAAALPARLGPARQGRAGARRGAQKSGSATR